MAGTVDLHALAAGMANRRPGRTEANVQSDLHLLLTAADLDLGENDLAEIILESPAGQRRRIDVEVGFTVFEVNRDLRVGNVRADAVDQLAGYVRSRTTMLEQRYVGVLTDGAEWHLHHLVDDQLHLTSSFHLTPTSPDVGALVVWLEGVLATTEKITPTPTEIETRLGASSPSHLLDYASLAALYTANRDNPGVVLKRQLWTQLLRTAFGENFTGDDELFVEHTLLVATAEIIAHAVTRRQHPGRHRPRRLPDLHLPGPARTRARSPARGRYPLRRPARTPRHARRADRLAPRRPISAGRPRPRRRTAHDAAARPRQA